MTDNHQTLRRSPARGLEADMTAASGPQVSLSEEPFASQFAVRARPETPSAAVVSEHLGTQLPGRVGEVTHGALPAGEGEVHVLWISPDEFLAVLPDLPRPHRHAEGITAALESAGPPRGHVIDVSANRGILLLSGPRARDVLETGVEVDLDTLPPGTAVATNLAGVGVMLWRVDHNGWRIMPRASFTRHVVAWLIDAMGEYR